MEAAVSVRTTTNCATWACSPNHRTTPQRTRLRYRNVCRPAVSRSNVEVLRGAKLTSATTIYRLQSWQTLLRGNSSQGSTRSRRLRCGITRCVASRSISLLQVVKAARCSRAWPFTNNMLSTIRWRTWCSAKSIASTAGHSCSTSSAFSRSSTSSLSFLLGIRLSRCHASSPKQSYTQASSRKSTHSTTFGLWSWQSCLAFSLLSASWSLEHTSFTTRQSSRSIQYCKSKVWPLKLWYATRSLGSVTPSCQSYVHCLPRAIQKLIGRVRRPRRRSFPASLN